MEARTYNHYSCLGPVWIFDQLAVGQGTIFSVHWPGVGDKPESNYMKFLFFSGNLDLERGMR